MHLSNNSHNNDAWSSNLSPGILLSSEETQSAQDCGSIATNVAASIQLTASSHQNCVLNLLSIPQKILKAENSVRGAISLHFEKLKQVLVKDPQRLPFKNFIDLSIANPQCFGQQPITFNRQVLSCLMDPEIINLEPPLYPKDVLHRAKTCLEAFPTFGSYSESKGIELFRQEISRWYTERDEVPIDIAHIYLTDGISSALHLVLELFIDTPDDGILVPVPHYPMYTATITKLVKKSLYEHRSQGKGCRCLVVIDPGNPSGTILEKDKKEEILQFCSDEGLVLVVDEAYHENIYLPNYTYTSFRKVAHAMHSTNEMFLLYSSSKGLNGECGPRGGLILAENIDSQVEAILTKLTTISLCANTIGQAMIGVISNPPKSEEESYALYQSERSLIFESFKSKALLVTTRLNQLKGIQCHSINAGMSAFPRIFLPEVFLQEANQLKMDPDLLFCIQLLEATGVVTIPGSAFGQLPGTYHFRLTLLVSETTLIEALNRIEFFNDHYLRRRDVV